MNQDEPKDKAMTDKEKADCMLQLHRDRLEKFKQTRDLEFKVNIALWSGIIVASYFIKQSLSECCFTCFTLLYFIIGLIVLILHYECWMKPIEKSETRDQELMNNYRKKVYELTSIEIPEKYPPKSKWIYFEVGITAFLLVLAYMYIVI